MSGNANGEYFGMSFSSLFPSRFEMRSSNSDKKRSLNGSFCLKDTYPAEISSIHKGGGVQFPLPFPLYICNSKKYLSVVFSGRYRIWSLLFSYDV